MSAFGYTTTGIEVDVNTDQIVYVPETNNYREYLKYCNRLYAEGLLDKNLYSNKDSDLAYNGQEGLVGSFSSSGAFLVVGNTLDNDYVALPPLTSSVNNVKMCYQFGYQSSPTALIINQTSPYYRELVRWMDVFYSEAFEILQTFGEENVDWQWNDAEKTNWTFNVPQDMEREQFRATLTYQAGLGGAIVLTDFGRKENSAQNQKIYRELDVYKPYWRTPLPILQYQLSEMQQLALLEADLGTYMTTAEANFITGRKDPNSDSDWNAHLSSLSKMKSSELKNIYSNAYGRHKQA